MSHQHTPRHAAGPAFVDASGRRLRHVRRVGWFIVAAAGACLLVVLSTALGGPSLKAPFLPPTALMAQPEPGPDTGAPTTTPPAASSPEPPVGTSPSTDGPPGTDPTDATEATDVAADPSTTGSDPTRTTSLTTAPTPTRSATTSTPTPTPTATERGRPETPGAPVRPTPPNKP